MLGFCRSFTVLSALIIGLASAPAHAQAWIGQVVGDMMAQQRAIELEQACRTGTPMPPDEIDETRASTRASINGYWNAVRQGTANVVPYYQPDGKAKWIAGGKTVGLAGLTRVTDPFVGNGAALDATPIAYFRAGDGRSVGGQWVVRNADSSLIGTYDALFRRTEGVWRLSELSLIPAGSYVEPLVQYCHTVGDVLPYRVSWTTRQRALLEARAAKLEAKAAKAREAAAKGSRSDEEAVLIQKRAVDAAERARRAREAARLAAEANELALADAKAAEAARSVGRAAATH